MAEGVSTHLLFVWFGFGVLWAGKLSYRLAVTCPRAQDKWRHKDEESPVFGPLVQGFLFVFSCSKMKVQFKGHFCGVTVWEHLIKNSILMMEIQKSDI